MVKTKYDLSDLRVSDCELQVGDELQVGGKRDLGEPSVIQDPFISMGFPSPARGDCHH